MACGGGLRLKITRRRFLKLGAMAGAGLVLPLGTLAVPVTRMAASTAMRSPGVEPFRVPMPMPPVLEPVRTDGGADYYEIVQRATKQEILPGLKTEVWGYEGIFPGPTVEARSGRNVVIRQRNELPVPVATHLHGGKTPPESDGYPTDLIPPKNIAHDHSTNGHGSMGMGGSRHSSDYVYPMEQRAATLWYHDHHMIFTGPQV